MSAGRCFLRKFANFIFFSSSSSSKGSDWECGFFWPYEIFFRNLNSPNFFILEKKEPSPPVLRKRRPKKHTKLNARLRGHWKSAGDLALRALIGSPLCFMHGWAPWKPTITSLATQPQPTQTHDPRKVQNRQCVSS